MISRQIENELLEISKEYPVVTITGPRQSGKTTLVRKLFSDYNYVSVEAPDIRERAVLDPRGFLSSVSIPVIIDEIQQVPSLLSYIQTIVDNGVDEGSYILTGSHQPKLNEAISQSLAGRTGVLTLLPFSAKEIDLVNSKTEQWDFILQGGYPRIYDKNLKLKRFFNSYIKTYVERDVRQIIQIKDSFSFQQFLKLSAGRIGSLLNYSSLSNDVGISSQTIKEWYSVLEASFITFRLQPFFANIRKRMVKSPKLYFHDTGLASYFLGIYSTEILLRDPLRGMLFENAVISEILKQRYARGVMEEIYFYRDNHGNEVDLCIETERKLYLIEIKSAATFSKHFLKGLNYLKELLKDKVASSFVFYSGEESFKINDVMVLNPFLHGIPDVLLK